MKQWQWILHQLSGKLWLRASIFALIAIMSAFVGNLFRDFIPDDFSRKVDKKSVEDILHIMANSMLVVTTFSLSTMVSAYSAATSNATPRSTRLLLADDTSQNALSSFIGAFLFSLVGILALNNDLYGEKGRIIFLGVAIIAIIYVVITLLHWIDYLSKLGRMDHTINLVETATSKAMQNHIKKPCLGCLPLGDYKPDITHVSVNSREAGYVEHVDLTRLSEIADKHRLKIYLSCLPGGFCDGFKPLAYVSDPILLQEVYDDIAACFIVKDVRSFEQDPRFGLIVLSEIASRALSPAVNDPGTAIAIINSGVRVLKPWVERPALKDTIDQSIEHPDIYAPVMHTKDLMTDIYQPIARDGAGFIEVGIRLQKALKALAAMENNHDSAEVALKEQAQTALDYAEQALKLDSEKKLLREHAYLCHEADE